MTSDYRRGVEDATKPLDVGEHMSLGSSVGRSAPTEKILANRRKSLLTKKVTRWVNLYNDASGHGYHYPTKKQAEQGRSLPGNGWLGDHYIGTFPIEIEVPID